MIDDFDLTATDRDICEPLDTVSVCHNLNDSESLCQPSRWAGEAIQDAINATQSAMNDLRAALQFYVSSEPYYNARVNASRLVFQIRRRVQDEFARHTAHFHGVVDVLKKLAPLGLVLMLHAAYTHLRRYLASDRYDNVYVTDGFRAIDARRAAMVAGGRGILPLKPYERTSLIDISERRLAPSERRCNGSGLAVAALFALLAVACVVFDCVLYWLLALVERHGRPGFDATGSDSLDLVVDGDGVIVELLDVFLRGFHPGRWFSFSDDRQHTCLPQPRPPSAANLVALAVLQVVLVSVVVFRARLRRCRCRVAGYFYRDREKARLAHLYAVIVARRARLPRLLYPVVRSRYRETQLGVHGGLVHRVASRFLSLKCAGRQCCCCRCCRACCCTSLECLICGARSGGGLAFQTCAGGVCRAAYCYHCFDDLDRICPLCLQGAADLRGGYYDALNDEEDFCNSLDDELKSYCKTGITGV